MNPNEESSDARRASLFVQRTFFGGCRAHNELNNHENQYCFDCEKPACTHCLEEGGHNNHKVITIYRLVYMDVVTVNDIVNHLNCSRVQPYTSNGKQVLALSPLPHQGSGSLKPKISCQFCSRRLMDKDRYSFCSIACKYQITTGKSTTKPKSIRPPPPNKGPGRGGGGGGGAGPKKGKNTKTGTGLRRRQASTGTGRRKGIPVRSPFF